MWFDRLIRFVRGLARLVLAAALFALSLLLVAKFASGPLVDRILANALRTDERKMPPTVTNYRASGEDIDIVGGMGQGLSCSLPRMLEAIGFPRDEQTASISLQMRQACVHHDLCYRHGAATYGYGQVDCDMLLQQNAFKLCTQFSGSRSSVTKCETEARQITLGVLLGGSDSFRRADSAPADSQPRCAYCRYLAIWNVWRRDYWIDEPARWDDRSSTYYEFDGHPQRSNEFISVRIADAPANWPNVTKAYYVFRTRPSGVQLRILGMRKDGRRLCAAMRLGGDFRFRSSLPVVARMARSEGGPAEDWFVWMRQNETSAPETAFSGLAPGRASASDWFRVFGSGQDITDEALCEGDAVSLTKQAPAPTTSFVDAKARNKNDKERFVGLNAVYPDILSANKPSSPGVMTLFGLTDQICALNWDRSSCVVSIRISMGEDGATVRREPFKTYEPNCLAQPIAVEKPDAKTVGNPKRDGGRPTIAKRSNEHCDSYRNFVLPPRIVRADSPPGLAWTRRGASNGEGYPQNAILRWAPADDRTEPDDQAEPTPTSYPQIPLERLKERYEPTAWTAADARGRQGMVSIVPSVACGGLKVMRFAVEPGTAEARPGVRSTRCLPDLDASWLSRPWRLIDGGRVMLFRMSYSERAVCPAPEITYCVERPWPTSGLEVAEFDLDLTDDAAERPDRADMSRMIKTTISPLLFAQYFCLLEKPKLQDNPDLSGQQDFLDNQDSRKHFASATKCASGKQARTGIEVGVETELTEARLDEEARDRNISSLINRTPIVVGDIDGDASPDIALLSLTSTRR